MKTDPSGISDIDNVDGFPTVVVRRIKRRTRTESKTRGPSAYPVITTATHPLTVAYTPIPQSDSRAKISRRGLPVFLANLAPCQTRELQTNAITVDALSVLTAKALLQVKIISGIPVRPHIP